MDSTKTKKTLQNLSRVLADFKGQGTSDKITIALLQTLIAVAQNEGANQSDIVKASHSNVPATSRNLMGLDTKTKAGIGGMGMVTGQRSPHSDREKNYYLTPKGRAFIERVTAMLGGDE